MVPRGPDRAERPSGITSTHRLNRHDDRTSSVHCCLGRKWVQGRIRIKLHQAVVDWPVDNCRNMLR
jgi:hypothetical protein